MLHSNWEIDLQLFADGEGETPESSPATGGDSAVSEPTTTPISAQAPTAQSQEPPSLSASGLNEFFAQLEEREAQTPQAVGGAVITSPAGSTPPAPQAGSVQQPAHQVPVAQTPVQQQPVVQIPPDLLTTLGQLAMRALPETQTAQTPAVPEPQLPELPEPPDLLKGTPEEREAKYYEDPIAFQEALFDHKQQVARVQAERDRITQEHKQRMDYAKRTGDFQQAFTKHVVSLGSEVFEQRAPVVQEILKANPALMQLPPAQAVDMAFKIAEERTRPQPVDVQQLTQDQRQALKAALQQEIIQEYVQAVASGHKPPAVISGSISAGKPPITPPNRPQDLEAAKRQWMASMPQ